ncbi:DUF3099 domain-containing protein [Rothia sp. LK2588]|uniref:DUF3099 domain-containing protein n=1 Tax=Rothia sp. LK2588 TaxID=3114369 RepID=UPI0034CD61E5
MSQKYWTAEDLREYGFGSAEPEVHSITSAQSRHSTDVDHRFKSYALKMFLRIVFIVLGIFADGWLMWACFIAAAVVPWVAVVEANGNHRAETNDFSAYLTPEQRLMLESASANEPEQEYPNRPHAERDEYEDVYTSDAIDRTEEDIIEGEIIETPAASDSSPRP